MLVCLHWFSFCIQTGLKPVLNRFFVFEQLNNRLSHLFAHLEPKTVVDANAEANVSILGLVLI